MVKVYSTETLLEHLKYGLSFRPEGRGIILILRGSVQLVLNKKRDTYQAGELILLAPQNIYEVEIFSSDFQLYIVSFAHRLFSEHVNFNFNLLHSFRMVQRGAREKDYAIALNEMEFKHQLEWIRQLEFYVRIENRSNVVENIIIHLISALGLALAEKLSGRFTKGNVITGRKEEIAMEFLRLAEKYFMEERELDFYAERLFISIKYLSNCVRETTGLPPTHFLHHFQINRAKELLLNTNDPIYQISENLHFGDSYSFGKFFKKHTGVSPRHFRNQNQRIDTI